MSDDDGTRAEELELSLRNAWVEGRVAKILAAFEAVREEEREKCAKIASRFCFCESAFPGCDPCRIETAIRTAGVTA